MKQRCPRMLLPTAALTGAALLLAPFASATESPLSEPDPLPSRAGDFTLKLEPGVAVPLSSPQSQLFDVGGSATVKALWLLNRYLAIGPSATFISLPTEGSHGESGNVWTFGGSIVVKRPHDLPTTGRYYGISPWADADALYVRTGPLNRAALAAAVGISIPVGKERAFWVGPFVRYLQILQVEEAGFDTRDARILSVGISLEVGSGVRRRPEIAPAAEVPCVTAVSQTSVLCADRDNDGICDTADQCPDVAGARENSGCPEYKKIVVKPDKIELKEKLYFGFDQATLEEASTPTLDEVVQALKDNKGFRVEVEGNTSSEGTEAHNQTLSEDRAKTVLNYLVSHGIDRGRLSSKGFGSAVPLDTNTTIAGRENNRRVEFVVQFNVLTKGGN